MVIILVCLVTFGALLILSYAFKFFSYSRKNRTRNLPLPPGSLGWPYIGETFQLYSENPNVFFASKQKKFVKELGFGLVVSFPRALTKVMSSILTSSDLILEYGPVFKSHILGCPCVMISSPEAAKFVLSTRANLFKPTFPASKERMLGKQALFFNQGDYHAKLRKLVLRAFMPDSIRNYVSDIDSIASHTLQSLQGSLINTFQEMKSYTFNVALLSIFGKDEVNYREDLKRCYYILEKGYNSMPINLPGTLFNKSMKARKELAKMVSEIILSRREKKKDYQDLLSSFMGDKEGLTDEQIADNVIGVIFAARDTTASVLTWIIKYLVDHPSILDAVTEEQETIIKEKEESGEENVLCWTDTKKMPFTTKVILETLRVASILSFTFREAVQDVEYQGYLIPKGWKVLPLFRNIHHSPENFPDPQKFDPSRFEVAPKPNTFLPFGNGIHSCPGNELAKLEILVLLHHLTTKYRWSIIGPQNEIQYGPFALPQNGLPIKLSLKSQE